MPWWLYSSLGGCATLSVVFFHICGPTGAFSYCPFSMKAQPFSQSTEQCTHSWTVGFWKTQTQAVLHNVLCIWSLANMGVTVMRLPFQIILKQKGKKRRRGKSKGKSFISWAICGLLTTQEIILSLHAFTIVALSAAISKLCCLHLRITVQHG